jgi:hypothetical protein
VLPHAAAPVSEVDKFVWRKIFDRNPLFVMACDKLAAKRYALAVCPELKTAAVLWTGDDAARIPDDVLAGDVVVKANHCSRWNIMVRNGQVDRAALTARTASWMRRQYGRGFAEWAYRDATRALLVEVMLLQDGEPVRTEYKFHVSGGRTTYVFAAPRPEDDTRKFHLDRDGNVFLDARGTAAAPSSFARMRRMAEALAAPFDYVRVDFYDTPDGIYFSELTVYPMSGQGGGHPRLRALRNAGWDLRKSWFLSTPQRGWRRLYAQALRRRLDRAAQHGSG